jgi:hypothetical protein
VEAHLSPRWPPSGPDPPYINSLTTALELHWAIWSDFDCRYGEFELSIKSSAYLRPRTLCLAYHHPTSVFSNADRSMEDSTNVRGSVKSFDEKNSFEDIVAPTRTTSATNFIRLLSQKLLTWGVEARGAYHIECGT